MKDVLPTALAELRGWPHWVVWRTEKRKDKPTKVPYQAAKPSRRASSTDPTTWGTWEQAAVAVDEERAAGVGYVFAPDDEYTGVDLDKCIEPVDTPFARALGPTIVEPARRFVTALDSYTELSPTGTGLHVIVRGRVNGTRNRTGKTPWGGEFEFYDHARFFTITGEHLAGTRETIEARQDILDKLTAELFAPAEHTNGKSPLPPLLVAVTAPADDVALEEKIRASKQGAKFADLFDRGAPEGKDSEADLGLCNILAFWTGPSETNIDRWFRRSALMRDKWDEKRGDTTYGGYTIARALEGRTEFYGQRKTKRHDDVTTSPGEEISRICGLIDDPFISGWRSGRQAKSRVVLTTRSGAALDLESWKAATGTPKTLAQELRLQIGVDVTLKQEHVNRLDVLIGKFCELSEAATIADRARELAEALLQTAEEHRFRMDDPELKGKAFCKLRDTHPSTKAKADGKSLAEACVVLKDTATGKRYVRIQWFVDYVKANAVAGTVGLILEQIEAPEWWSRPNAQGRFFAVDPDNGKRVSQVLYEVPKDWEKTSDTP
jgi:hypothetical protein